MNKIQLIKKIVKYHPSSDVGKKLGVCDYTGGMKDTGNWYWEKLVDLDFKTLKKLLEDLKIEWKPSPPRIYTLEEELKRKTFVVFGNTITNQLEKEEMIKFCQEQERKMFGL
jgi:hypothetical protein